MAIEISPSDEHEPDQHQEGPADQPVLQTVPPQDSPAQFYEWALRREQVRLRKLMWAFAAFATLTVLIVAVLSYFVWDTRSDRQPVRDVVVQEDPNAASRGSVEALQEELAALSDRVEELAGAGDPSEDLGEVVEQQERVGRQLARLNRQTTAAVECLNGSVASLDEAVRDLLRQDISANQFVQRPASNCG